MSKKVLLSLAVSILLILCFALPVMAVKPNGETPAQETICDPLKGATPGLYGLCVAFCEAQDCEPDLSLENPLANCNPSSAKLLEIYNSKKNPGDLDMPCIIQKNYDCPCFATEFLESFNLPYDRCVLNHSSENIYGWAETWSSLYNYIVAGSGPYAIASFRYLVSTPNNIQYTCAAGYVPQQPGNIFLTIPYEKYLDCKEMIEQRISEQSCREILY